MSAQVRVGFIGLGSQGGPMARVIAEAGFPTTLWARRPESLTPYEDTAATFAASPRELGMRSDVVGVCVVADDDVDAVLRGPDGVLAGLATGGIVLVHSTTRPETCTRLQADFPHINVLDAPVSGGGHRAAVRELLVMVGGDASAFDRCRPVLETFANPFVHLGPLGSGQRAKLLNNALFTAQLGLVADAFAIARRHGLETAGLTAVLAAGSSRSYAAEIVAASGGDLAAFAAFAGELLAKDVGILTALQAGDRTPLVAAANTALGQLGVTRNEVEPA